MIGISDRGSGSDRDRDRGSDRDNDSDRDRDRDSGRDRDSDSDSDRDSGRDRDRDRDRYYSLQCGRILGARVHIFVLDCHLGFANCEGLGRGKIYRGSRWEVEKSGEAKKCPPLRPLPQPSTGQATIQDGGIENLVCRAFRTKLTPALQAMGTSDNGNDRDSDSNRGSDRDR